MKGIETMHRAIALPLAAIKRPLPRNEGD